MTIKTILRHDIIPLSGPTKGVYPERRRRALSVDLKTGDRLTRAEFERRYDAHPEIKKAELIEGEVYVMSSPVSLEHGGSHFELIGWLGNYVAFTPGVKGCDNTTLRLNDLNEPQPDIGLYIRPKNGGQCRINKGYLEGAPELIIEVAGSSAELDLNKKKTVYAQACVREYIVAETKPHLLHWFVLDNGVYAVLNADGDGIFRSRVFPGLWLNAAALWNGDLRSMLAVLQQGLATPEHQVFVEKLQGTSRNQ